MNKSGVIILAIILPVWFILQVGGVLFTWNPESVNQVEATIKTWSEQIAQEGGEVLFVSQRQLLALTQVDVALILSYEQDDLMEMVMSHNKRTWINFKTIFASNDLR
jgi:hypothetical protein